MRAPVRPPHYHARLAALDEAVTGRLAAEGVRVVRDGSFLAVAAADENMRRSRRRRGLPPPFPGIWAAGLKPATFTRSLRGNGKVSLPVVDGVPVKAPVPPPGDAPAAAATLEARYERPLPDARLAGSFGGDGDVRRRPPDRRDPQPGGLSPAPRIGRCAWPGARSDPCPPRAGRRLLRP